MEARTKGILSYLLLAFGIAWIAWEIPLRLGVPVRSAVFILAAMPGALAPAIAAIVTRRWVTREGFADAGLRLSLRHWRYYLVAWLLPVAVVGAIVLMATSLGVGRPDFTLQRAGEALGTENVHTLGLPPAVLWPLLLVQCLVGALIVTPVLWGEEFGWRGYLQVRLFADRPLLAASEVAKILHGFEPHVPWEQALLSNRYEDYMAAEDPLAARAQKDLTEYLRRESKPLMSSPSHSPSVPSPSAN